MLTKLVNGIEVELTQKEIDEVLLREQEWKAQQEAYALVAYRDLRAKEYPNIGDQLDAIFTLLQDLRDKKAIAPPESVNTVLDDVIAVKAKYPKPGTK